MNWIILIIAGLFEVAFAYCLGKAKESSGNEMYVWYAGFLIALAISMGLLVKATQTLPIGTAYAVWVFQTADGRKSKASQNFGSPAFPWLLMNKKPHRDPLTKCCLMNRNIMRPGLIKDLRLFFLNSSLSDL